MPAGGTGFDDAVHGRIEFDGANIEDFVILRSDGHPTYHLSVVVDDVDMAITHVIRGDDHISNTPKHVLLFEALGAAVPRFAHVPLILGADKKRLSKRHGATSVTEYERQGYLPDGDGELPGAARLVAGRRPRGDDVSMSSSRRSRSTASAAGNAVFNTDKLDWMNGQYIARLPLGELAELVRPLFAEAGLGGDARWWMIRRRSSACSSLLRPRVKRLTEFVEQARPLLAEPVEYEPEAVTKHLTTPDLAGHLAALVEALRTADHFDEPHVEATVRGHGEPARH